MLLTPNHSQLGLVKVAMLSTVLCHLQNIIEVQYCFYDLFTWNVHNSPLTVYVTIVQRTMRNIIIIALLILNPIDIYNSFAAILVSTSCTRPQYHPLPIPLTPRFCSIDIEKFNDSFLRNNYWTRVAVIHTIGYDNIILVCLIFSHPR